MSILDSCPVCNSKNIKGLKLGDTAYSCCNACSLVFRNPFPAENEDVNLLCDASGYYLREYNDDEKIRSEVKANHGRVEQIVSFDRLKKYRSLLDIGSGPGYFVRAAKDHGYAAYGIDISRDMVSFGREKLGIDLYQCAYERFFDTVHGIDRIDILTSYHSLEHIREPYHFFKFANRIIKPGGLIVIEVPYIFSFESMARGEKWEGITSSHLYFYTPESLRILLNKNHFQVLDCKHSISSIYFNDVHGYVSRFFHNQAKIDRISSTYTGTSMQLVARKPLYPLDNKNIVGRVLDRSASIKNTLNARFFTHK